MPKPTDHKKITLVTFLTAILGLLSMWPVLSYPWYVILIRNIGDSVYLSWVRDDNFRVFGANGPILIAYLLLLIGGVLYAISKHRESRLIRFVFSIILISKAYFVLLDIFSLFKPHIRGSELIWTIIHIVINAGWALLAWWVLKQFKEEKTPAVEHIQYGDTVTEVLVTDSLWQRLFHLIADTLLCIFIFSVNLYLLADMEPIRLYLNHVASAIGERMTLAIILGIYRLVYYVFFESLLCATPAKLLTESRVLTRDGERPALKTIVGRTFSRFIPFEALSFFGSSGWHDRFSDTVVVKEKRTGVSGATYFLLIPLFLGFYVVANFASRLYEKHSFEDKREKEADLLIEKLDMADTNSVFILRPLQKYWYIGGRVYLKVDKVSPSSITFSKIVSTTDDGDASQRSIEEQYNDNKATLEHYTYSKEALKNAVNAGKMVRGDTLGVKIGQAQYGITDIQSYFMPNLQLQYGQNSGGPEDVRIYLSNIGWAATVSEIKVTEGDVHLTNLLPAHLRQNKYVGTGLPFVITGTRKSNTDFKLNLLLTDTLNRVQGYDLEVIRNEVTLKRAK